MLRSFLAGSLLALLAFTPASAWGAEFVSPGLIHLAWEPAEGPVLGYGVFLSRDGAEFRETPDIVVIEPRTTLVIPPFERLVLKVAAYDRRAQRGPFSPESEVIVGLNDATAVAPSSPFDFDGDGRSDLLWREASSRRSVIWLMDESEPWLLAELEIPADEIIEACADLDGDGRSDLLLANAVTGDRSAWFMDGTKLRESRSLAAPRRPAEGEDAWHFVTTGDFDGDGDADLVFRFQQYARILYLEDGQVADESFVSAEGIRLPRAATPDLDGDGAADLFWWEPETGLTEAWLIVAGQVTNRWPSNAPRNARLVGAGDIDGDGRDDVVWSLPDDRLRVWLMNGVIDARFFTPWPTQTGWSAQILADLDGDGRSNDLVLRTAGGDNDWLSLDDASGAVTASALPWVPPVWDLVRN